MVILDTRCYLELSFTVGVHHNPNLFLWTVSAAFRCLVLRMLIHKTKTSKTHPTQWFYVFFFFIKTGHIVQGNYLEDFIHLHNIVQFPYRNRPIEYRNCTEIYKRVEAFLSGGLVNCSVKFHFYKLSYKKLWPILQKSKQTQKSLSETAQLFLHCSHLFFSRKNTPQGMTSVYTKII